jgi:hypothetical protein
MRSAGAGAVFSITLDGAPFVQGSLMLALALRPSVAYEQIRTHASAAQPLPMASLNVIAPVLAHALVAALAPSPTVGTVVIASLIAILVYLGGMVAATRAGAMISARLTPEHEAFGAWIGAAWCVPVSLAGALAAPCPSGIALLIIAIGAAFSYDSAMRGAALLLSSQGPTRNAIAAACTVVGTGPALIVYGV